jgi:hypothetical protein
VIRLRKRVHRDKPVLYYFVGRESMDYLEDKNLSWRAKGIMTYLISRPESRSFSLYDFAALSTEGRDAASVALKELIESGYIERVQTKDEKGRTSGNAYTIK